jgi:hypothetical protein
MWIMPPAGRSAEDDGSSQSRRLTVEDPSSSTCVHDRAVGRVRRLQRMRCGLRSAVSWHSIQVFEFLNASDSIYKIIKISKGNI